MTGNDATLAVIQALEALAIPYLLVGSYSTNVYGVPRATEDADFVIQLGSQSFSQIADRLGPQFVLDPQMSFESFTSTYRHILLIPEISFRIELFHLSDDPHDQERFRRRRRVTILNCTASVPTVEDVIITKLRWSQLGRRTKDRDDVQDVIAVQDARVDWPYVYSWCDQHGTRDLLDEIRRSIPPLERP